MENVSILICEDEELIAHDLKCSLEQLGYEVCGISDSFDHAINLVDKKIPDLALMDICIKGDANGIDLAEKFKNNYSIPVIYLTSLNDENTLEKAKKTEPLGYLNKPFNKNELKNAIEIGLYRHRQQQHLKGEFENTRNKLSEEISKVSVAERIIEMQKDLLEVQKMDAVRKISAGIAHHVNNTLYAVIGSLQYIGECIIDKRKDNSQLLELIGSVLAKCDRTSLVVQKLQLFSEDNFFNTQDVSAVELIADAINGLHPGIKNKTRIQTFFSAGNLTVNVDSSKVKQMIVDIIINAHDALLNGGIISVNTELKSKSEIVSFKPRTDYYLSITISDNGIGMNESDLRKALEPFYSTKSDGESLGLGLTLAYSTMHKHGGELIINSFEGIGTSVSLYFPYHFNSSQTNGKYH